MQHGYYTKQWNLIGPHSLGILQKVQPMGSLSHHKVNWDIMHALLNMYSKIPILRPPLGLSKSGL